MHCLQLACRQAGSEFSDWPENRRTDSLPTESHCRLDAFPSKGDGCLARFDFFVAASTEDGFRVAPDFLGNIFERIRFIAATIFDGRANYSAGIGDEIGDDHNATPV